MEDESVLDISAKFCNWCIFWSFLDAYYHIQECHHYPDCNTFHCCILQLCVGMRLHWRQCLRRRRQGHRCLGYVCGRRRHRRGIVVAVEVGAVVIRGISVELRYRCWGRGDVICVVSRLRGITGLSGIAGLSGIIGLAVESSVSSASPVSTAST